MASCNSCGAAIVWVENEKSGKPMPVDAEPTPNGNLAVVNGKAHTYRLEDHAVHRERFTSHFATCPQADDWRRPSDAGEDGRARRGKR